MANRPENIKRRVIGDKEYSCKKLPYRQARELQFELGAVLGPLAVLFRDSGDMEMTDALPVILGGLGVKGPELIIRLCETCYVGGNRVNPDSFNGDDTLDLEIAALALETHFANFIKKLPDAIGRLGAAMDTPT